MSHTPGVAIFLLVALLSPHAPAADRPDKKSLQAIADGYLAKKPVNPPPVGLTYDDALATQKAYLEILEPSLGERAGYKVGIVTPAGQQRMNIPHPVRGVLFKKMLLPNNSSVPVNYGTRAVVEPDLLVRVKDAALNNATTIEEAARHLSEIVCFIELADGNFDTNAPIDGAGLVASNVGARMGITGETRKIENTPEFLEAFRKMPLVLKDSSGKELSRVTADGVMGHPLNAVLWFVQDLKRTGEKVKPGDVISLGSPSPAFTPKPGDKITLVYEGLPGGPLQARVSFK